ncbi:hypothetical protein GCM10009817_40370 [Terrabacter lapilli]|uniref:Uncharacterized protein n=1 Tax=Terrabacter lapilli TaxID=436231 RepID=A0ABN2SWX7_9MICO
MTRDAASAAESAERAAASHDEEAATREFRRAWAPPPAGRARRRWAAFGISGRLSAGWVLTLLVFSVIALGNIPGSILARDDARLLQAHGKSFVCDEVEVHVSHVSGRGGGYNTVDGVRVTVPGSTDPVELESVGADSSATQDIYDPMKVGWQTPDSQTGYRPPLPIRILRDENGVIATAMTQRDYEYQLSAYEPEGEAVLGIACLVLAALSLLLNRVRLRRRARRLGYGCA